MKIFDWDSENNKMLKRERHISFEEVVLYIERGDILNIVPHPNKKRYPNQRIYLVDIDNYVYLVPFVESEDMVFLKTIIPSRKATKAYLGKRGDV